jgi:hypothetical protein
MLTDSTDIVKALQNVCWKKKILEKRSQLW